MPWPGSRASGFLNRVHKFDSCRGHYYLFLHLGQRRGVTGIRFVAAPLATPNLHLRSVASWHTRGTRYWR
jgi:hypothetical protein